jgi:hypothetical protein
MERKDIIQAIQEGLLKTMLTNHDLKATDRNPTAGNMLLAFNSFQDFFDDFKKQWPLPRYSHVDKLFAALIEVYFVWQLKSFLNPQKGDDDETWRQDIKEATKGIEAELVQILKTKYPHICAEIEEKRNAQPNSPIF